MSVAHQLCVHIEVRLARRILDGDTRALRDDAEPPRIHRAAAGHLAAGHLAGGSADAARAAAPPLSARACARAITLRSTAPSRPNGGHELQQCECRSLGRVRACEPCGVWPCQAEFMNCHERRVMNFVNSEFVNFRRFVNERDQFMNTGVHHARKVRVL